MSSKNSSSTAALMLDLNRVFDKVYAHAAADALVEGVDRPPVLTRAQRPLLRRIALDVSAVVVFRLIPAVTFADNTSDDKVDDFIYLGVVTPVGQTVLRMVEQIESLIAIGVLRSVWSGTDTPMARKYDVAFNEHIGILRRGIIGIGRPGVIRPSY